MPFGRAAEADRRVAVDAPVERRALNKLPAVAFALYFNDRHAFAGLGFAHLFGRRRQAAVGVQVAVVGVFVVDRQQGAVGVVGEGEQAHAVVVVAKLHLLSVGAAIAAEVKGRAVGVQGLAPTDQHRGAVAGWQAEAVAGGGVDAGKAQQGACGRTDPGSQRAAAEQVATQKHRRAA